MKHLHKIVRICRLGDAIFGKVLATWSDPITTYKVTHYRIVSVIPPCESPDGRFPGITDQPL